MKLKIEIEATDYGWTEKVFKNDAAVYSATFMKTDYGAKQHSGDTTDKLADVDDKLADLIDDFSGYDVMKYVDQKMDEGEE